MYSGLMNGRQTSTVKTVKWPGMAKEWVSKSDSRSPDNSEMVYMAVSCTGKLTFMHAVCT